MLASLLKQLLVNRKQAVSAVESLHRDFVTQHKQPTISDLEKTIISVANEFDDIYLIFDALDECDENTQRPKILSFIGQTSRRPFKLLVTSRPHPVDIQNSFRMALKVEISAHRSDMEVVIRNKIDAKRAQGITLSPELANDIVRVLLQPGEGM